MEILSTTEISRKLGFIVKVELLKSIGIVPAYTKDVGTYWKADDFDYICCKLAAYLLMKIE